MNPLAVALVLGSCSMHAGWNLLARAGRREGAFIGRMLLIAVAAGLVPAVTAEALCGVISGTTWLYVLGSGACCGVYYFALARAYGSSDFTVVYPVARSLPVLFVAIGDVARHRWPAPLGWVGMVLVVGGCFLAPLHSFRDVSLRHYWHRGSLWMLLTAAGTVGYTLLDKLAAEVVSAGPGSAAVYGYFFFLFSWAAYGGLNGIGRLLGGRGPGGGRCPRPAAAPSETPAVRDAAIPSAAWRLLLAAALNFGAYWLVLWAYQLGRRASYIVALRQFSIVLGVVAAFTIYREKGLAVRLTGTVLITIGLVLIAVWGG